MDPEEAIARSFAILLIKPSDYGTFQLLVLDHIANSEGARSPQSLAGTFVRAHGKKLWPTEKKSRSHLDPSPALNIVHHWAGNKSRRQKEPPNGPIFQYDASMSAQARKTWRKNHNNDEPSVLEEQALSKLGRAVQSVIEKVFSISPKARATESSLREQALVDRIVNGNSELPPSRLQLQDQSAKTIVDFGRDVQRVDEVALSTHLSDIENSSTRPVHTTSRANARNFEDHDAAQAIKKIRSFAFQGDQSSEKGTKGRKRSMEPVATTETITLSPKKQRSSPQRGRFSIPQGLHRMEALPMKRLSLPVNRPQSQQDLGPDHYASRHRRETQVPLMDSQGMCADFRITEIPFNFMELVTNMPYPHVNEEARRKRLGLYLEETGGMGGLPVAP